MIHAATVLAIAVLALPAQAPKRTAAPVLTRAATRVALAFDVGARADRSFNEAANQGLARASTELGVQAWVGETTAGRTRSQVVDAMLEQNADVVVGVGFLFQEDLASRARTRPGQKFVCVDCRALPGMDVPPNLLVVAFRDEEGGFLAGALAAAGSKTGQVGFVGGMDAPVTRRFLAGFGRGARHVHPNTRVVSVFAGTTPVAFTQPDAGRRLATELYRSGSDVLFHAAGATGLGVMEAARAEKKLAVGVDRDQESEAPGHVLGSVVKRVDLAVFESIRDVKENRFRGGVMEMGAIDGGLALVASEAQQKLLSADALARVRAAEKDLREGRVSFP